MFGVYNPGFGFNLVTRDQDQVDGDISLPITDLNHNPRHTCTVIYLHL